MANPEMPALYAEELKIVLKVVKQLADATTIVGYGKDGTTVTVDEITLKVDGSVPVRLVNRYGTWAIALDASPLF